MTLQLTLIGIGTGNPEHLTLQAIRAMNAQDLILIPHKGTGKNDLAQLRHEICAEVLTNPATRIIEFELPVRNEATQNYRKRVDDWHDEIAAIWQSAIISNGAPQNVALLVWGDPSLYDSTLRIASRLMPTPEITVIPGITSLQTLTAAHATVLNEIGAPFIVTTGRRLRDEGWPPGVDTVAVMLDAGAAFEAIAPEGIYIWWGAYVGMKEQIVIEGPLIDVAGEITKVRARARNAHGWIMDIYLLKKL
ncbi:precorrin-6A synthase (deacetylating) [Sulfitobacter guttiformis]|uniref:Precorrin-6A synthase [deacetylating] n=1 Tax=Sulfitobacter guttiformis TaxID=74349 RepID=A0A420DSR8_9RHOB|nr:precorrin-6A synthase (deacetylating) [Sulfitobacter guttiformis]KIN74623.1 Precorrin-6A synthase (Deacetylating) [Sulfitobacter guttiformis KCTC 32187]RKE97200.1 precorrin-6A synthase (deacetylating) [Sulfitobacter guttiformis]